MASAARTWIPIVGLLVVPVAGIVAMALPRAPAPSIPRQPEVHGQAEGTASAPIDAAQLRRCCSALHQNAKSSPPEQKESYLAAAAVCDALAKDGGTRDALDAFRRSPIIPSSCRF
jgi:hypothetical protein